MSGRRLRLLALTLMVALTPSSAQAPPPTISALAPFETPVDARTDLVGVAVAPDGVAYVSDRASGFVHAVAPDGHVTTVLSGLDHPAGLALDDGGRLLVVEERGGRILRREPSGAITVLASGLRTPRWLARGDDGSLYVSAHRLDGADGPDPSEGRAIVRRDPAGALTVVAAGIRQLEGLVVVEDALIAASKGLVANAALSGALLRFVIEPDGTLGAPQVWTTAGLQAPTGLAVDVLGAVYASAVKLDTLKRTIAKVHPDAHATMFAEDLGDPQGLALGPDGSLYLADGHAGRVVRFRAPPAPTLAPLPSFTSQSSVQASGQAAAGSRIDVSSDAAAVSIPADGAGAFSVSVALAPDISNTLIARATGYLGDGLTGAAAAATIVQDSAAPAVTILAPPPGVLVRGVVVVQVLATDAGAGVASITVSVDGQAVGTVTNPTPGPSFAASVSVDTAAIADGVHTLAAAGTDAGGARRTVSQGLTTDNTPPETTITAGPSGTIGETTATFEFTGADAVTPATQLQFAWRLDGGPWSPFAATTSSTFTGLAPGPHAFEVVARDQAGNEDPTPARRELTVVAASAIAVQIVEPVAGAVVPAGELLVRGTVDVVPEVAVTVNGVAAAISGGTFVALIPLATDITTLEAVATAANGGTGRHTVTISVAAAVDSGMQLSAAPASGVAPHVVTFTLAGVPEGSQVSLDADGNGTADAVWDGRTPQSLSYQTPGAYVARATVVDPAGATTVLTAIVQVFDQAVLDALLQGKWTGMKDALRAGDIPRALTYIVERRQPSYDAAFRILLARLPGIDAILTPIELVEVRNASASYRMLRVDGGVLKSFLVRFAIDGDGVWRLEGF